MRSKQFYQVIDIINIDPKTEKPKEDWLKKSGYG